MRGVYSKVRRFRRNHRLMFLVQTAHFSISSARRLQNVLFQWTAAFQSSLSPFPSEQWEQALYPHPFRFTCTILAAETRECVEKWCRGVNHPTKRTRPWRWAKCPAWPQKEDFWLTRCAVGEVAPTVVPGGSANPNCNIWGKCSILSGGGI